MKQVFWDVILNGQVIDSVPYDADCSADYVRRGLIGHDNYDPAIEVRPRINHTERLDQINAVDVAAKHFRENRWGLRHAQAWASPNGFEAGIVGLLKALANYADQHLARYESRIGEDGVIGTAWAEALGAARTMLNGELGRLDGGTLDHSICEMATAEGISPEDL